MNKRFEFSMKLKKAMRTRSRDICEATGALYGKKPGETCPAKAKDFDHVIPDYLVRAKPKAIEEGLHVCGPCHRHKTKHHDMPKIAKARRIDKARAGVVRDRVKIPSAPFQHRLKSDDKASRIAANHKAHMERMAMKGGQ